MRKYCGTLIRNLIRKSKCFKTTKGTTCLWSGWTRGECWTPSQDTRPSKSSSLKCLQKWTSESKRGSLKLSQMELSFTTFTPIKTALSSRSMTLYSSVMSFSTFQTHSLDKNSSTRKLTEIRLFTFKPASTLLSTFSTIK